MQTITLSDQVLAVLNALEAGDTPDEKVARLVQQELRRRLARYQLTDRLFRNKYGMSLAEFEEQNIVAQSNYSFEVESDHQDWDLAVDGMRTIEHQLEQLQDHL